MNSDQIRQAFIDFFVERGHTQLPSLPLVPTDPGITTLFTIAGMQQLIPYFLGRETPPSRRLVSVQKSMRTSDIEGVGDDTHTTFLEMLGNFSIGDYFKRESIGYTWEFLTQNMRIAPDRWWATIYPGDSEARDAWLAVGMPAERIGETEENWWQQGPVGPCGPDSEIHYDRGPQYGCGRPDCRPENECCDRFIEVWNNVFIMKFRTESGELTDLPWNNIDTGMGLERLTAVKQGVESVYHTDLFAPIVSVVMRLAEIEDRSDQRVERSLRIIADHSRSVTFLISDGVLPSSDGRGYVLRRLLRRAALHGRLLGLDGPFMIEPVQEVIRIMSGYYTDLQEKRQHILQIVQDEERRFLQTLTRGLAVFEDMAQRSTGTDVISGADAFVLYDTHGFPLELTEELATERGLAVDREGFYEAYRQQQERARQHQRSSHGITTSPETYVSIADRVEPTLFTGYEELGRTTEVVAMVAGGQSVLRAETGDNVEIVLAATPFYAESGGQVGDTGLIRSDGGTASVTDTQRPHSALIIHSALVVEGSISVGDVVIAEVDTERRLHILPHHSGTHLLHKALQEVLGPDATQHGSLVAPDRLRFDFHWPRPLTSEELREVQDCVNAAIWANLPVRTSILSYDEALRSGATALFSEKYGEFVRVVSMGDWSKELCGGTHVNATGDIGLLVITSQTGIGEGVRRVEALAGAAAYAYVNDLRDYLAEAANVLDTRPEHVVEKSQRLRQDVRQLEKHAAALEKRLAVREAEVLLRAGISIDGMTVVADRISADTEKYLEAATDAVKSRLDRGIVVLGTVVDGKPRFIMAVTRNLKDEGYNANTILREAAQFAHGGAGGNAERAVGGGGDVTKVDEVLQAAVDLIRKRAEE